MSLRKRIGPMLAGMTEDTIQGFQVCHQVQEVTTTPTESDVLYAVPFVVTRPMIISSLAIQIVKEDSRVFAKKKRARLGLYNTALNNLPGDLVMDFNEVDTNAPGLMYAMLPVTISKPGLFWTVIVATGALVLRAHRLAWSPLGTSKDAIYETNNLIKVPFKFKALPSEFPDGGVISSMPAPVIAAKVVL